MQNETDLTNTSFLPGRDFLEISLSPVQNEAQISTTFPKLPLSRLSALGTAFEPISSVVQQIFESAGSKSGFYKVTIPPGTHLAKFKNGSGNLGAVLGANDQLVGQAVLNPVALNPTMIFMAATLVQIDKKMDAIQELQKEMMDFLVLKEKAELRGNLVFLSDILTNYRYNWNNDMYKNSSHIKVLDIRQTAEQKILFYRDQIEARLRKKSFIHSAKNVQNQIDVVRDSLKEYQLSLYTHAFASFLDVMLIGNFSSEYICGIVQKIDGYSFLYRELYTKCYDALESYYGSSVESTMLKGLKAVSKATGEALAKVPVIGRGQVDEALIEAGSRLDKIESQRTLQELNKLVGQQSSCVKPFIESLETIERIHNKPLQMIFDKDAIYLGPADSE